MTQVDFYVISGGGMDESLNVACRLAEKAVRRGNVYMHTADAEQTQLLDEKLWSYRSDSFLPHEVAADNAPQDSAPQEAIVIGHHIPPTDFNDVLINLSLEIPNFHGRFMRLLEVVPGEHSAREACRENYAFYRDRGYPLNKLDIDP